MTAMRLHRYGASRFGKIGAGARMVLPLPYDAEVEYLESDGYAYIDTGIEPDDSIELEATIRVTNFTNNPYIIGFGPNSDTPYQWAILFRASYTYQSVIVVRGAYTASASYRVGVASFTSIRLTKSSLIVNGNVRSYPGSDVFPRAGCRVFVFAGGGTTRPFGVCNNGIYIKSAKVYKNGICVWDANAVRVGTEGAMYDRVSGKLFRNRGTGAFVIGPDINAPAI